MEKTLYETLAGLAAANPARFHMPGHKGRGSKTAETDFTELEGLDNLHAPKGIIKTAQEQAAAFFGAERTFFLVNGASSGIIASVLAQTEENFPVVCARNSHISVYKGLCLSGARPVYAEAELIPGLGICGGVNPESIGRALAENSDATAVFIVSPTYEGVTSNIRKIAEISHKHGIPLVVDEAHGSHFGFGSVFPETALSQGADVVIQSWHKTLNALGQAAVLHVNGSRVDTERLAFYLSVLQTTSPSYALMASLDRNRALLEQQGNTLFARYERNLGYLRLGLSKTGSFRLLGKEIVGEASVTGFDPGKIVLLSNGAGMELDAFLRERGIYAEMSLPGYVLLMTSFMDRKHDYKRLLEAVAEFEPANGVCGDTLEKPLACIFSRIPEAVVTPRECLKRRSETIPVERAEGRVCAGFLTPYPPGIPIAAPGEVITPEIVEYCAEHGKKTEIHGLSENGNIKVLA